MASLRERVELADKRVNEIVSSAAVRIDEEANNVLRPLTSQYGRDISAMSIQLRRASRIAWSWACAAGSLSLLLALAGWASLNHYRREIATARSELDRYDAAIPVLQAYYVSDATLCGTASASMWTPRVYGKASVGSIGKRGRGLSANVLGLGGPRIFPFPCVMFAVSSLGH